MPEHSRKSPPLPRENTARSLARKTQRITLALCAALCLLTAATVLLFLWK